MAKPSKYIDVEAEESGEETSPEEEEDEEDEEDVDDADLSSEGDDEPHVYMSSHFDSLVNPRKRLRDDERLFAIEQKLKEIVEFQTKLMERLNDNDTFIRRVIASQSTRVMGNLGSK